MVLDLPNQDDPDFFRKIEVPVAPASLQDLEYNVTKIKEDYLEEVWVLQKIGITTERVQNVSHDIQAQRKQYGLKHSITFTIHTAMFDTLIKVTMENSNENGMFKLWDNPQVIFFAAEQ